jgi:hypothetical protein
MLRNKIFYTLKPAIPRRLQILIRRQISLYKRRKYAHIWPIDPSSNKPPDSWAGWPDGKKFALLLCHDVDTQKGHDKCLNLAELETKLGFRSYFNFVPERYHNSGSVLRELPKRGFEIGVHGLKHDGKLFSCRTTFSRRADKINKYLEKWNTKGFTSPSMHHNLDWMHELNISYSTSTFDTDPFEPQSDGIGSIFPVWVQNGQKPKRYLELPYTLPQDHLLFTILQERSIEIWKGKLDWIAEHGGMALLNTHTDYMCFDGEKLGNEEYPVNYYAEFLEYIEAKYVGQYWNALPGEVVQFWKEKVNTKAAFMGKLCDN